MTARATSSLTRGYLIGLLSALILSTTAIFISYLIKTYHMPPLVLALWRDGLVAAVLLLALAILRPALLRVSQPNLRYLVGYGLLLAVFNSLWTVSVAMNGAAVSTVLAYSSAGFTALLGWWLLKERLSWAIGLAVVLSFVGCVLVSGAYDSAAWRSNVLGIVAGILSGLCYAIYTLLGRSASQRGLNPWTTLLFTFGFAAIFLLGFNLLPAGILPGAASRPADLLWLGDAWVGWGILFALAAGPTVMGFGLYMISLTYLPSSVANLIVTLEPAFTAAIAYALLGEQLTLLQVGGSAMIIAGVVVLRLMEGKPSSAVSVVSASEAEVL